MGSEDVHGRRRDGQRRFKCENWQIEVLSGVRMIGKPQNTTALVIALEYYKEGDGWLERQ